MSMRFAPWTGASGCTTGPEPGAKALLAFLSETFPEGRSMGIFNCREVVGGSSTSVHGEGRALDYGMPMVNGRGSPAGHAIVRRLGEKGSALGVQAIIYDRTIWSAVSPEGRPYKGAAPHFDHLHIEMTRQAARAMTLTTFRTVLSSGTSGRVTTPGSEEFPGKPIRRGDRGEVVRRIQVKLNIGADGIFGPVTDAAVRAFQGSHGLAADGIVGPLTWKALFVVQPAVSPESVR